MVIVAERAEFWEANRIAVASTHNKVVRIRY